MKIRRLNIKNIASIESATIAFDSGPVAQEPVFLICGDTGSGKSTILNAICLALYDKVPSLESTGLSGVDNEGLQNDNTRQLLRRGKAHGRIELAFTGVDKKEYIAVWEVQRSYKKITGTLQKTQRTIECEGVCYTKSAELKDVITRAVGLTFDQFMRTTMLAQGQFASFMRAEDKKKSEILEKLTGTDIFAQIGQEVHDRYRNSTQQCTVLEAEIRGAHLLDDEAKQKLAEEIQRLEASTKEKTEYLTKLDARISWLRQDKSLKEHRTRCEETIAKATEAVHSDEHISRSTLITKWDETAAIRDTMKRCVKLTSQIADYNKQLGQKGCKYRETIAGGVEWLKADLMKKLNITDISDYSLVESAINTLVEEHAAMQKEYETLEAAYSAFGVEQLQSKWESAGKECLKIDQTLEKSKTLTALRKEAEAINAEIEKKIQELKELEVEGVKLEKVRPDLEKCHEHLKGYLEGQKSITDHITQLRNIFADSKECPLCGNPDAHIHTDEQLNALLKEAIENERNAQKALDDCLQGIQSNKTNHELQTSYLKKIEENLKNKKQDISAAEKELSKLAPYFKQEGFDEILAQRKKELEKERENISQRLKEATNLRSKADECRKGMVKKEKECNNAREMKRRIDSCVAECETLKKLFGTPAIVKPMRVENIEEAIRVHTSEVNQLRGAIQSYNEEAEAVAEAINLYFQDSAYTRGEVESIGLYEERTIKTYRDKNQKEEEALKDSKTALETVETQIGQHQQTRPEIPEGTTIESDLVERTEVASGKDEELNQLGRARQTCDADIQAAKRLEEKISRLELLKEENGRLGILDKIFGGDKGVNFRNIAQSYVLRALLEKANYYMLRLMPRYRLGCLDGSLTINVFDTYQADAMRNVGLLSGGETFVVSLALALGLSAIGKEHIGVDTLFIDEGFGSLDSQTLDTVITTLYNLHSIGGRRVGIISHVPELKERIPTQIRLRRIGQGASEVEIYRQ